MPEGQLSMGKVAPSSLVRYSAFSMIEWRLSEG
jgi:hypothetical protein